MIINIIKQIINILCAVTMLSAVSFFARADCPGQLTIQGPDSITVDASIPVGGTLWSSTLHADSGLSTCAGGNFTIYFRGTGLYRGNNVYDTSIPGVGIKLRFASGGDLCTYEWWPTSCNRTWGPGTVAFNLEVMLVKTGVITTSGTLEGIFANWTASNGKTLFNHIWAGGGIHVTPAIPTCSPVTNHIEVPLGSVPAHSFGGVGTTSPAKQFELALNCSGGQGGTTGIYVTLSDQSNPANRSNILPLTSESTAQGLGIQILNSGTPIHFGAPSGDIGNTNQWFAGTTGNGVFSVPLTARYIKTNTTLVPGSANGVAIFTIGYQ